jgi:AraC-like DNA-binding protein
MAEGTEIISLIPQGSPHRVIGERRIILPSVTLEILSTRLIELETWALKGLNDPFWRLYLPISGKALVWTSNDDLDSQTVLGAGQAYLIPPRTTIHSSNPQPFSKWYVHFTLGASGDRATPGVFPVKLTPAMQSTLKTLPNLCDVPFPWATAGLVAEALQQLPSDIWTRRQVDLRVEKAMDFMHANLARKLSVDDVARAAGMSARNLNHLFQQHLEMSPMRVLLDFRLDKSCRLLRHGDASIEQIAEDCGFPNRYYFSRMLKQHRGTSPAAYRRAEV